MLPRTASTVIVGGGIVGAATAHFLADRGETDVLVIERGALGSGTTAGGLGGIRHQFVDELDVRLSLMASAFWREFEAFTGSAHAFEQRGYLFIVQTEEGLAQMREPLPLYERLGVPVKMLEQSDIAKLVPGLRTDDLSGGRFCATDGYGDAPTALAGFASAATLEGATFVEHTAVTEVVRDGDRVTGVRTSAGDVSAERVLLATGCWTSALARTAGVEVPIWPYRRSIFESTPLPRLARIPMTIEWESGFHFRPSPRGGVTQRFAVPNIASAGLIEKGPASPPRSFDELTFPPLEVPPQLSPWARARAAHRHEAFADLTFARSWSCYYEMTPDDHPIVGWVPGVRGLAIAAGFSGHGFMHTPATAQLIAEELLDGKAHTLDISDLSLERFQSGRRPFTATVL
ncbi:MAG: FAD-binding oxidoreductase [Chloroflexi bacterium]|nr:FAD-binding oxidoreductase [Chloroflexota bacterium]